LGASFSSTTIRGICTWAYHFTSDDEVASFVWDAKVAGYNYIFVFNGWLQWGGQATNMQNEGGIYISTDDTYLQPIVLGDWGTKILQEGHKQGLKVVAVEGMLDAYGVSGKIYHKPLDIPNTSVPYDFATWYPEVQEFWQHYTAAIKNAGFDGVSFDEVGSGYREHGNYTALQKEGYTQIFTQATNLFLSEDIFLSLGEMNSAEYDFTTWKQMGLSFAPWTIMAEGTFQEYYPLPIELVNITNRVVVWIFPAGATPEQTAKSQLLNAKSKGAVGGVYWVEFPDIESLFPHFVPWDWTGRYAQIITEVFPPETQELFTDVNGDRMVDLKDVYATAKAYNSTEGQPRWNPACDFNKDSIVDLKDYYAVCKNYGKIC
jgi:hypothetical protein